MKKESKLLIVFLAAFLLISLSVVLVAAETNWDVFSKSIGGGINKALSQLKLDTLDLTTILLGILLWMILVSVLKTVGMFQNLENKEIWSGAAALIITLLAILYMPPSFAQGISALYRSMGATILVVLPFIIMFYFTTSITESYLIARGVWIIFFGYTIVMFLTGPAYVPEGTETVSAWLYGSAAFGALVMFITIPWWRKAFWAEQFSSKKEKANRRVKEGVEGIKTFGRAFKSLGE